MSRSWSSSADSRLPTPQLHCFFRSFQHPKIGLSEPFQFQFLCDGVGPGGDVVPVAHVSEPPAEASVQTADRRGDVGPVVFPCKQAVLPDPGHLPDDDIFDVLAFLLHRPLAHPTGRARGRHGDAEGPKWSHLQAGGFDVDKLESVQQPALGVHRTAQDDGAVVLDAEDVVNGPAVDRDARMVKSVGDPFGHLPRRPVRGCVGD